MPGRRVLLLSISIGVLGMLLWWAEPRDVFVRLGRFPTSVLAGMAALISLNLFIVLLRSWRILGFFGVRLPFLTAARANVAGYVAGLVSIPLLGQIVGRQIFLGKLNVRPAVNAAQIAYERAILAITSASLAFLGLLHLLGDGWAQQILERVSLAQVGLAAFGGGVLSLLIGHGHFENRLARQWMVWRNANHMLQDIVIAVAGQVVMVAAFAVGFSYVAPAIPMHQLFAAATIISFAASIPVSFGGWGVRELAAVSVMGLLGVSVPDALAVSVVVGMVSTLTVIAAALLLLGRPYRSGPAPALGPTAKPEGEAVNDSLKSATWILGFVTAVAVFFQLHVPLAGGMANINMADPLAMLALAAVGLHAVTSKQLPHWRVARFNGALIAISLILVASFIHGWFEVGVTQWALSGRLFGWLVLLGYLAAGYLMVEHHGNHGVHRFVETLAAVACTVVAMQATLRVLSAYDMMPLGALPASFEGYAGNRNAFAFQLLMVTALVLGYSHTYTIAAHAIRWRRVGTVVFVGLLLTGITLTGSRAALGTLAIMLLIAMLTRLADRRTIVASLVLAGGLWLLLTYAQGGTHIHGAPQLHGAYLQTPFSSETSDQARWDANRHALSMWLSEPVLGIGLGVFLAKSTQWSAVPIIIHSTPLWVLTEFGLLGFGIFGWLFYLLVRRVFPIWNKLPRNSRDRALLFVLLAGVVFAQVHEILYQRILWLTLGVLLAMFSPRKATN
jgi:hypothetical protein